MSSSGTDADAQDKPVKIDKWDGTALKNALDDAAKKVMLDKYNMKESHSLMDGRLMICTVAVGFAMFALIWDYLNPFPASRTVLIICVLSYFLLMGVLTLYTTYTEKGIFLVALDKDKAGVDPDDIWTLASVLKKYDDIYMLSLTFEDGKTKKQRTVEKGHSVANYFDEEGSLCVEKFEPFVRLLKDSLNFEKKGN
ncbi:signal peptidase complex subunit 2 [Patella vulgata]|uniref:signal peptidase complex subunit 2 n=1 Tax=Patella vulgata TaxID=6465 RepID=UPI002180009E|nr:signal peptidase complex subunit 2 [Patella vulgata]